MNLTRLEHSVCGTKLLVASLDIPQLSCPRCLLGFQLPGWKTEAIQSPFMDQSKLGCSVVIKPTRGDFTGYNVGDDLHIGIADSMTNVYSYWFNGISVESAGWCQSSVVYRFDDDDDMGFDSLLSSFVSFDASRFEGELYDCTKWNCFDFVMEFMRFINFRNYSKTDFVSEFVQSALGNIVKYKSLLRRVEENGHILL